MFHGAEKTPGVPLSLGNVNLKVNRFYKMGKKEL